MESVFKTKIASRGWHLYRKLFHLNQKLEKNYQFAKKKGKVAIEIDLYVVRWKLKRIERIAPVVVGHMPRQILRAICFFPEKGGAVTVKLFEERCRSFFIYFERWFRDFFTDQNFNRSRKQEVSQQVKMYHLWKLWPFFRDEFLFFCKEGKELEEE